jgi:hypothetical protein
MAFIQQISSGATPLVNGAEQPIARLGGVLTAFVGRTLRGPLNHPLTINSFAEYQQEFGGLWQPSMLSYAVEQFFEQGGRQAVVVRVANGGSPATISLPCERGVLRLQALAPGTREYLRAAVDYDNLSASGADDNEHTRDCFNLVVQRVRAPGSERIEVQETHRRVSVHPGTQRYVANVLLESKLVRVLGDVPELRPLATFHATSVHATHDLAATNHPAGYAVAGNDGDDGAQLSDYDIIGSALAHTGLFALAGTDNLGFVYIPPLARDVDVGASTLLVAEKFCRERRALLIVDPPLAWATPEQAMLGAQAFEFHSEHALMYFPRLIATDRLRARSETFPNGGAVAGMLARAEEQRPAWAMEAPEPEHVLRSGVRLAVTLSELDHWRFATHGINTLRIARNASVVRLVPRTLAGGINGAADFGYLAPQRLASFVVNSIERGTRWVLGSRCEPGVWTRVTRQVIEFLTDLTALGAFPAAPADRAFMVVCDQRTNSAMDIAAAQLHILVVIAGSRLGHYHGFLITHSANGSLIKRISVNQLELPIVAEPQIHSVANGDGLISLVATRSIA